MRYKTINFNFHAIFGNGFTFVCNLAMVHYHFSSIFLVIWIYWTQSAHGIIQSICIRYVLFVGFVSIHFKCFHDFKKVKESSVVAPICIFHRLKVSHDMIHASSFCLAYGFQSIEHNVKLHSNETKFWQSKSKKQKFKKKIQKKFLNS